MFNIPCVILSGGKSSRMGEDKSLLPFKNFNTLIEYQYDKYSKLFKNVYISSKTDKFDFLIDKSKLIIDSNKIFSPMIALDSIFEVLKVEKIFIVTVDIPFVKIDTINKLILESSGYDIIVAKDKEKTHNLCGIFSNKILDNIKLSLFNDIHKINYLLKKSNTKELEFNFKEQFLNINTLEDYKKSLSLR